MGINRRSIAALSLSAAALVGLALNEGYTDRAVIPVRGDVPTIGFGTTQGVKMGDTITPPKALSRTLEHIQNDEAGIKRCVTAPLSQSEYDLMVDFAYQYGTGALCKSSIVREANAGRYKESCAAYLLYRKVAGRDCSVAGSGCRGVWLRSQGRYTKCMEEQ